MYKSVTFILIIFLLWVHYGCNAPWREKDDVTKLYSADSLPAFFSDSASPIKSDSILPEKYAEGQTIDTKNAKPTQVVDFAESLIGIGYKYGSTDPLKGFDCSGFISYVFQHFGVTVPRSSIDYTHVGKTVDIRKSRYGDLILFTGTDSTKHYIGHIGLIVRNENGIVEFIHASSGKVYGVTITPFNDYYNTRFLKTIRIFPENSW